MEQEVIYRIALSRLKGINKALAQHIHETVESLETFFELPESQLQKITGIKGRILHEDNAACRATVPTRLPASVMPTW